MAFFSAALTAPQLVKLRGDSTTPPTWAADQLVTLWPNDTIFAARVNGAATGTFAQVTFDTVTTGAYTDIEVGMRVIISPTNNRRDKSAFVGRVRKTPTSTILYINETSVDIADDSYIFVIEDYPLLDKLARPTSTTVQAKDFEETFQRIAPVVSGLKAIYIDYIDSSSGKFRVAFDVSASYVGDNDAASISSYAFTFEAGTYTIISGSLTSSAVTLDFNEGYQIGKLVITDSSGVTWTRRIRIAAHGTTFTPTFGFEGAQITATLDEGYTCAVTAFDEVDSMLDDTFMVVWRSKEYFNGTEGELVSGENVDFVGWITREDNRGQSDPTYSFESDVSFEVIGVGQKLAQLEMQLLAVRDNAAPDEWDEIENLYPWRAMVHLLQRHTTFLNLFPFDFDTNIKNSTYRFPFIGTQGGNVLAALKGIGDQLNASIEFHPAGGIFVCRNAQYLASAARTALVNIADLDNRDLLSISESLSHFKRVGKVDGDGAFFNTTSELVVALRSRAPGHAQGSGTDSGALNNQILASTTDQASAETELNLRTATQLVIINDEGNQIELSVPDGYDEAFIPTYGNTYTLTLDGSENVRGISYTTSTKWFCIQKTSTHNNETGSRDVSVILKQLLPIPSGGDTVPQLNPGDISPIIPDIPSPAFDFEFPETMFPLAGLTLAQIDPKLLQPPKGKVAKTDGSTLLVKATDGTKAYLITNFIALTTPQAYDVTPSDLGSYTIRGVLFDPFNIAESGGNKRAYILASDGTNSKVWSTTNIFARPVVWTSSSAFSGIYTTIRGTNTAGGILIYTPDPSAVETEYNLIAGQNSFTETSFASFGQDTTPDTAGVYTAGVGYEDTQYHNNTTNYQYRGLFVERAITSATLTSIRIIFDRTVSTPAEATIGVDIYGYLGAVSVINHSSGVPGPSGTDAVFEWTGSATVDKIFVSASVGRVSGSSDPGGTMTLKKVVITSGSGSGANVRHSSDYAATFGSTVSVGTSPGSDGGFDTQRAGTRSFASSDNQVKVATTLGGAYSNAGGGGFSNDPACIIVPWYTKNSTSSKNTDSSDPDFIIGLNGGTSTLYWVTGATDTQNDITPLASAVVPSPNVITTQYGTHIAAIVSDSGTYKLYTSTNGGTSWTFRVSLNAFASFIRTRRNDTRAKLGGNKGQLFWTNGTTMGYSYDWGATRSTRNMPVSVDGFDILN